MRRVIIFSLAIAVVLASVPLTFAHEEGDDLTVEEHTALEAELEVTAEELGVDSPGILPTNPFYFFKEFSRNVRRFFAFDPTRRAELELTILNEKAAELEVVEELDPNNVDAIAGAVENYNENVERLRVRLEGLAETSENPNIDRLLDQLTDRALRHQQLFDELGEKHTEIRERIENAHDGLDDAVRPAFDRIGTCEEFEERLRAFIAENGDSPRAILQAIRMLDRLGDRVDDDEHEDCLERLRAILVERLGSDITEDDIDIDTLLEGIPGGDRVRLRLVDEIRDGARAELRIRLEDSRLRILERIEAGAIDVEDVREMLDEAHERVSKLRDRIGSGEYRVPESARRLLTEAESLLARARAAFDEGRYGAAFGEANAARVAAKAGLSQLVKIDDDDEDVEDEDERDGEGEDDDIRRTPFRQAPQSRDQIRLEDLEPTPIRDLANCIQLYDPVCGKNGRTYSNACFARVAGVEIDHRGECRDNSGEGSAGSTSDHDGRLDDNVGDDD